MSGFAARRRAKALRWVRSRRLLAMTSRMERKEIHQFPAGQTVCEPVFVADPHGKHEEDGFVFSFVHDQSKPEGPFVILDARHLGVAPLATVRLGRRILPGYMGIGRQ
jgi:carotenoid cleavage dioxygenase-like enzyme